MVPVLLIEIVFPRAAGRRWLPRPAVAALMAVLAMTIAAGVGAAADRPPQALVLIAVLAAVAVALSLPARHSSTTDDPGALASAGPGVPSAGRLRLAGAGATAGFFLLFAIVPGLLAAAVRPGGLGPWQPLLIVLMTGYFCLVIWTGRRWCTRPEWGSSQTLAVITGALLPRIAASPLCTP